MNTEKNAVVQAVYGDATYEKIQGCKGTNRVTFKDLEVPFEIDGDDLLLAKAALIELLPTIEGRKQSGTITLIFHKLDKTFERTFDVEVVGDASVLEEIRFEERTMPMHAYSSSSSKATLENYKDYFNEYRVNEYAETGLDIWYEQAVHVAENETELNEALEHLIGLLSKKGLKIMLSDDVFAKLSRLTTSIIGTEVTCGGKTKKINSEEELDQLVEERLSIYIDNPTVYGVSVGDEQTYLQVANGFGGVLQSIHRVLKKIGREDFYVNVNLVPMTTGRLYLTGEGNDDQPNYATYIETEMDDKIAQYETYLEKYVEVSGNDYIQYDLYTFTSDDKFWKYEGKGIDMYTFQNLLVTDGVCKKHGLDLKVVTQSLCYYGIRHFTPADISWENNMLLAYGVKHISYFVYQCRDFTGTENWQQDTTFLDIDGNKNDLYYIMQGQIAEIRRMQSVILGFDYEWSNLYCCEKHHSDASMYRAGKILMDRRYEPTYGELLSLETSGDWTLATGLRGKTNSKMRMYAIQNVFNHFDDELLQEITVFVSKEAGFAHVYEAGLRRVVKYESGKLTLKLSAGHAAFIILD